MNSSKEDFADLLTEALERIKRRERKTISAVQDEIGYEIGREGGSSIQYWRRGNLPDWQTVEKLAKVLMIKGQMSESWLHQFLFHGEHPNQELVYKELIPSKASAHHHQLAKDYDQQMSLPASIESTSSTTNSNQSLELIELANQVVRWKQFWGYLKDKRLWVLFLLGLAICLTYVYITPIRSWFIKTFNSGYSFCSWVDDDVSIIMVDSQVVAASPDKGEIGCVSLNDFIKPGQRHEITVINLNGPGLAHWDFRIYHHYGTPLWSKSLRVFDNQFSLTYNQLLILEPNSHIWETDWPTTNAIATDDRWEINLKGDDFALMLIDDRPITGGYDSNFCCFNWVDFSSFIKKDQSHTLTFIVYNVSKNTFWDIRVQKNGDEVWCNHLDETRANSGEVLRYTVTLSPTGEIEPTSHCSP